MKKVLAIVSIMLFAFNFQVFAQTQTTENTTKTKLTVQERTDKLITEMTTELTLTSDQVTLVTPVIYNAIQQRDLDKLTYAGNSEMLVSTRKQLISDTSQKLKQILSEDQMARLSKYWGSKKTRLK